MCRYECFVSVYVGISGIVLAGVRLNGRPYKQGNHCAYLPYVRRRGNLPGPGGREGSSQSHTLATIHLFYTFTLTDARGSNATRATFASVEQRPVTGRIRSLYIIDSIKEETRLSSFTHVHDPSIHILVHVDSITHKVMFVPHFDSDQAETKMCGICMWSAR